MFCGGRWTPVCWGHLPVTYFTSLLSTQGSLSAKWWIKGLAPSRRSQNPCKFPLPSWKKVLKEQRGEGNLQIKIYLWDEKEHIWRMGFSFPLTHFWRCAANPIIKLEKTSDIWEIMTNTVHMVQESTGQGCFSASSTDWIGYQETNTLSIAQFAFFV